MCWSGLRNSLQIWSQFLANSLAPVNSNLPAICGNMYISCPPENTSRSCPLISAHNVASHYHMIETETEIHKRIHKKKVLALRHAKVAGFFFIKNTPRSLSTPCQRPHVQRRLAHGGGWLWGSIYVHVVLSTRWVFVCWGQVPLNTYNVCYWRPSSPRYRTLFFPKNTTIICDARATRIMPKPTRHSGASVSNEALYNSWAHIVT